MANTFANLIHVEQPILGGAPVAAAALRASATCTGPTSGNWRCAIKWRLPGIPTPVSDAYEVQLTADGCFTATADAEEAHVGGPTLKTPRGETVTNLLYAFDGCFDTR